MMNSIMGMLGNLGLGSANMPLSASAPSLDALTLNPDVMSGGQSVPQIPYDYGQGPQGYGEAQPPLSPPGGNPEPDKDVDWTKKIEDYGKVIQSVGKMGSSLQKSPLAQQMFQEHSQKQMVANQMNAYKIEQFRRNDLSSQILEKYGLL